MNKEEYYNQDIPLEDGISTKIKDKNRVSFSILHQTFTITTSEEDTEEETIEHTRWLEVQLRKALAKLKFKDK